MLVDMQNTVDNCLPKEILTTRLCRGFNLVKRLKRGMTCNHVANPTPFVNIFLLPKNGQGLVEILFLFLKAKNLLQSDMM